MYILCVMMLIAIVLRMSGLEIGKTIWPAAKILFSIILVIALVKTFFFSWPFAVVVLILLVRWLGMTKGE